MKKNSEIEKYPAVFNITRSDTSWIENSLHKLSLREKCAQMIVPAVSGNFLNEDSKDFERVKKLVEDFKVGGLVFLKGDILDEG